MSLTTAVRSLYRSAKSKFPGASNDDIAVYVGHIYEAAATNLKSTYKDEEAVAAADEKLVEAASAYEEWAVNLRDAKLVNIVKPIVDNAVEKGVDPVLALILKDVPEAEAREYVAALAAREADSADEDGDEDGLGSFEADTEPVGSSI